MGSPPDRRPLPAASQAHDNTNFASQVGARCDIVQAKVEARLVRQRWYPPMDRRPVLIDLALQGGGSHGAFTWGVLDRLLEEPWLQIAGISGTSAGAMNAAVLADGWTEGGREGARAALDAYWKRVSRAAVFSPLQRTPYD